jgi:hypothetical protein
VEITYPLWKDCNNLSIVFQGRPIASRRSLCSQMYCDSERFIIEIIFRRVSFPVEQLITGNFGLET